MSNQEHYQLAVRLAGLFGRFPQVEAVALAGSLTSGTTPDPASDIDLYIYTTALIPLPDRFALVAEAGGASRADMNLDYWDLGDEWFHAGTGIEVDMMYWDTRWVEEMLDRVVRQHQASMGYSTSHWHTIRQSQPLFDRRGWFAGLLEKSAVPFPEPLRRAIIARNHSILRDVIPAYIHQVEKAAARDDLVSVNHRVASLLSSYFDILFAANRVLHPGEKRMVAQAERLCQRLPEGMAEQVASVLRFSGQPGRGVVDHINLLLDSLDGWLEKEEPWLFEVGQ